MGGAGRKALSVGGRLLRPRLGETEGRHQATRGHEAEEPKAGVLLVSVFFSCEDETGAQRLPGYAYLDLCAKCLQVLWEKLTDGSDS